MKRKSFIDKHDIHSTPTILINGCVLHWNQNHFVVLYKVKNGKYYIADPATKKLVYEESELARCWYSTVVEGKDTGAALLFEPGPDFYDREEEDTRTEKGLSFFFRYPDVIEAEMRLTSRKPVTEVVARTSGRVSSLYVRNRNRRASSDRASLPAAEKDLVGSEKELRRGSGRKSRKGVCLFCF